MTEPGDDESASPSEADSFLRAVVGAPEHGSEGAAGVDPARIAHFTILGRLGSGGMGVVYRVQDEKLRRTVALKVLRDASRDDERRQRFLREARLAAAITHPNVGGVHQVDEADGYAYIAMELIEGESLRRRLERGPLDVATARALGLQIARGLAAAHAKGMIHRDLKPENVMITPEGVVKLLDFGLAKSAAETEPSSKTEEALAKTATLVTMDGRRVMGTPAYMSPEQTMGERLDARSDVFSFGVVLYEMLVGTRPFTAKSAGALLVAIARDPMLPLRARAPHVDEATEALVRKCLAKLPGERFANAGEIVAVLGGSIPSIDAPPPNTGSVARTSEGELRRKPLFAIGGILLLLAAGATIALRFSDHRGSIPLRGAPQGAASASAALRFADLSIPKTDSPAALNQYRTAWSDVYDATRAIQNGMAKAVALDPTFAAAHLRLAFALDRPASALSYAQAARYREKLDPRDLALFAAEEPCDAPVTPNYAECLRRFSALRTERPLDPEILWRMALIELRIQSGSELATAERLAALDPNMAGAELLIGQALGSLKRFDDEAVHLQRCQELSPVAARCMARAGIAASRGGDCAAFDQALRRAAVVAPDDGFVVLDRLGLTLVTNGTRDNADVLQTQLAAFAVQDRNDKPDFSLYTEGHVALWFADFDRADAVLTKAAAAFRALDTSLAMTTYDQFAAVEEIGDPARTRSLLRRVVAQRAAVALDGWEGPLLRALRSDRTVSDAEIAKLRERWCAELRQDPSQTAWETWLACDAGPASTKEEANAALALPASEPEGRPLRLINEYEFGRVQLLAGHVAESVPHLERVATTCRPFRGFFTSSSLPAVSLASYELGQAREALGETQAACDAYERLLQHWGEAKPRSVTAEKARARRKSLGCAR